MGYLNPLWDANRVLDVVLRGSVVLTRAQTRRIVKYIGSNESTLQRIFVSEQLISQLKELRPQITPEQVLRRCSISRKLAQLLSEATTQIEEILVSRLQALQDARIVRGQADGKIEEPEATYARVGPDLPGSVTLSREDQSAMSIAGGEIQ